MGPRRLLPLLLLGLAACGGDATSPSPRGPGTLAARVVGPTPDDGAAHLRLVGSGIGTVTAPGGRVFLGRSGDTLDVVVALETPGVLELRVALTDTTSLPTAAILEVSGPDDQLRSSTGGSALEWVR